MYITNGVMISGYTPLQLAVNLGFDAVVTTLCTMNADVNKTNSVSAGFCLLGHVSVLPYAPHVSLCVSKLSTTSVSLGLFCWLVLAWDDFRCRFPCGCSCIFFPDRIQYGQTALDMAAIKEHKSIIDILKNVGHLPGAQHIRWSWHDFKTKVYVLLRCKNPCSLILLL